MLSAVEHIPIDQAVGRIAAEMVSPYPPGVPRILPGEIISHAQVQYFKVGMRAGFFPLDPSDASLKTLRVVKNQGLPRQSGWIVQRCNSQSLSSKVRHAPPDTASQ